MTLSNAVTIAVLSWGLLSPARVLAAPTEQGVAPNVEAPDPREAVADAAAETALYTIPSSANQVGLQLRRTGGLLEAVLCQRDCAWQDATRWTLPEPFVASSGQFSVIHLQQGVRAGRLVVRNEQRQYELVVAAPRPRGRTSGRATTPPSPVVAFVGETGFSQGEAPDRSGSVVRVLPTDEGFSHLVVGTLREDISVCGREALLVPKILHPETLSLRRVKLHRIPSAERENAQLLQPAQLGTRVPSAVFTPLVASSARGAPSALTDGDTGTTWTENRGGDGSGEFVVLRAPRSIGLTGLLLSVPEQFKPGYAPPRTLWVATDNEVFHLDLTHADPSSHEWYLPFPAAVNTGCLAIALDTAQPPQPSADTASDASPAFNVGLAEVAATTDVTEARLNQALADLDTGGDEAAVAERLLTAVGPSAFERVRKRYRGYSQSGRMRALNVMDAASCKVAVPVYVNALYSEEKAESEHAERRLLACKRPAVPVLSRRLTKASAARARALASTLVRLDPAAAVDAIAPLLSSGSRQKRRVLRQSFALAVANEQAAARVRDRLSGPVLAVKTGLPVMRALGEQLPSYRQAAVEHLLRWRRADDFETRYLLIAPAAQLAPFDRALASHLADLLRDGDAALRAEAARRAPALPPVYQALLGAVSDPHVRVREAAVVNLGEQGIEAARPALLGRLRDDPWPMVRAAAIRALANLPPEQLTLRRLAEVALEDESATVRRPALHALGRLRANTETDAVREAFLEDADMHVRAIAAATLGMLCDHGMTQELTERALSFATLSTTEADRIVGKASLSALGRLAPPDLQQRLSPFFGERVPRHAHSAAKAALSHPNQCAPDVAHRPSSKPASGGPHAASADAARPGHPQKESKEAPR